MVKNNKLWLLRFASIFLGIVILVLVEVVLRIGGVGERSFKRDPFFGFELKEPLIVPGRDAGIFRVYQVGFGYAGNEFNAQEFLMPKPDGEFRIFALGDSTTFGFPFWAGGAFPYLLELGLNRIDGSRIIR